MKYFVLIVTLCCLPSIYCFEWSYEQCSNGNDYLETPILKFEERNSELYVCAGPVHPLIKDKRTFKKLAVKSDPLAQCIFASMTYALQVDPNLVDPDNAPANRHYMTCLSHTSKKPNYAYRENLSTLLAWRKSK